MNIRHARAGDLAELLALERSVETAPHWSEGSWRETLSGGRCVLVLELDGELAGFAVGHVVAGILELESIAVRAELQRRGAGKRLMEALRTWAIAAGVSTLELEVRASNAGAIGFYRALGFTEQGRRPRYYSSPEDDAVMMSASV